MKTYRKNAIRAFLVVLSFLAVSTTLRADVTGAIAGVVRDNSQAVVSGARVQVTNVHTNLTQETTSGSDGTFHVLALPAGTYSLTATATGFRKFTATNIDLKVNDQLHLDITLQVGSLQETVSVEANGTLVIAERGGE